MKRPDFVFSAFAVALLILLQSFSIAVADPAVSECETSGGYRYVCGPQSAEDLVRVPDTAFIISSGYYGSQASLYLIDSRQKTWTELYPTDTPSARQDKETYGTCPGPPNAENFVTHGLNIRAGDSGHSTLYVVGHGEREAIEVFDVDANSERPVLTWTGCIVMPEHMEANSVASLGDGSLLVTVPLHPGKTIDDAMAGKSTGAVYRWSPGDIGFSLMPGTELPYGNGIEVSADEREFYVASSGLFTVVAFSNTNPARHLRTTDTLDFLPDNLHMGHDSKLITAGLVVKDPACGNLGGPHKFSLEEFASCPRPFIVRAIDPKTMQGENIAQGPANRAFSNITMALPLADEIWIGTFAGDRVAYRSIKQ